MNLYFSALIVIAVIFLVYIIKKRPNIDKILMGAFFFDILVFLPMIIKNDGIYSASSSAIYVLRIFAMEMGFTEFIEEVTAFSSFFGYHVIAAVLYVLSPVLAGAFILSFLMDRFKSLQLSLSISKKIYIFTQLHEGSLALAKSIEKKGSMIVFLCGEEEDSLLTEECNANGYMMIGCTAERVYSKVRRHILNLVRDREVSVFFVDKNEDVALAKMLNFLEGKNIGKKLIRTSVFLYSVSDEAELVIDSYKAKFKEMGLEKITLRLIDNVQIISYSILENYPLYNTAPKLIEKDYNVTIVGAGNVGTHFAKDVAWCGLSQHRGLKINLVDRKDADYTRNCFEYKFPELNTDNYNINYYSADVMTKDFDNLLKTKLADSNYFMVSMGDDEASIMVAHNIRMKFYRYNKSVPVIVVRISADDKYYAIRDVLDKLKINVVGTNSELYSFDAIYKNPIYKKAYLVDYTYNKRKGYTVKSFESFLNLKESVIRSNIAYSIHIDYKLWDITGINPMQAKANPAKITDAFNSLTDEEKHKLNVFEHFRWITFTRSEGWVSPFAEDDLTEVASATSAMLAFRQANEDNVVSGIDYEQNSDVKKAKLHQSMFSKQHGCIVDFEYLDTLDRVMGNPKGDFADFDKTLNEEMLNIWIKYVKSK